MIMVMMTMMMMACHLSSSLPTKIPSLSSFVFTVLFSHLNRELKKNKYSFHGMGSFL